MAKPKHVRYSHFAGPSSPVTPNPVPRPRARSHRSSPSPAVLSALAVIATTPPVVAGGPLPTPTPPPTFLCPFFERDTASPDILVTPTSPIPSSSTPSPTPTPTSNPLDRPPVADKFVQGSDSLWRKTDEWILYGSTCCSSSTPSTSGVLSQSSYSQTSMSTSISEFDTSVLPAGWDNTTDITSNTESTIILALAIVLASSICIFMIGCLVWRRRKKRTRDLERKLGADSSSQNNVREKDAQGKMRMWSKASARWKFNIRQSARRRRRRPMASSIINRPLSPTFSDFPRASILTPSRRGSFVSQEPDPPSSEAISCPNDDVTESPIVHDPPRSPSPPTYGASFIPTLPRLPPNSAVSGPSSTPSPDSLQAVQRSNQSSFVEDEPLPYIPPSDGHVATDDKAQLAHIRELASSPPTMVNSKSANTMQPVSVPEWHEVEDDLEDLGVDLSEASMSFRNFGLPPPPSKAAVSCGDDILLSLPIPELPEPSLGGSPSAPPTGVPGLEPSAPSLADEDDLFQDWDEASTFAPEVHTSVALDSAPTCAIEPSISSASRASILSVLESVARDGILPRYHP